MASLDSLFSGGDSAPSGFRLASLGTQASDLTEDAGIAQHRLLRNFGQFDLPDLTSRYASRGTFHSGMAGKAADKLRLGVSDQFGDLERRKSRGLSDIMTNSLLALTGYSV